MLNILIVDDDPNVVWGLSKQLDSMGYRSLFLFESNYLLEMLAQRQVDLILLDLCMPGVDVPHLIKTLKSHSHYRNIPIIMLSDRDDQSLIDCIELGALDFINKPVKKEHLQARMKLITNPANPAAIRSRA